MKQVGNYTLGIRKPPYFVIASGAKQSRVRANRSGLLRSARNDGITDAKAISAKQVQGDGKREAREPHTAQTIHRRKFKLTHQQITQNGIASCRERVSQ